MKRGVIITIGVILLLFFFAYFYFSQYSATTFVKSAFVKDEELQKCLQLPTQTFSGYPQRECLLELALKRGDPKICENDKGGSIQECQRDVAIKTENISLCADLIEIIKQTSYPQYQIAIAGKCYYKIALARNDSSVCDRSPNDDIRLYCSFHFQTEQATKEIIEKVTPQSESCKYTDSYNQEGELDYSYNNLMYKECGRI